MGEADILRLQRAPVPPPTGRVVLGFTDVQGSTELWESDPDAMREGLAMHDAIMRETLGALRGYEVKTEGDAFMVTFARPVDAVRWALTAQEALQAARWPHALLALEPARPGGGSRGLRVRMGLHLGEPDCRPDPVTGRMDYFGPVVNRAARIGACGHGGQLVVSQALWDEVHGEIAGAVTQQLGEHRLKGLARPEALVQVLPESLADRSFPPLRTIDVARHRPFRGLSAFRPEDAGFFFGRDVEADRIAAKIRAHPMVTVTGASGAGKSSLLQAGVLPRLVDHTMVVVRPGSRPWSNLCAAVEAEFAIDDDPVEAIRDRATGGQRVVVVVDQAEELLTLAADDEERDRFVSALVALGQSVSEPTRVVIAIREDFFGPLARLEPIRALYTRAVEVLTPPGPDGLREALVRPLARFGARFDDTTLPDEMVAAVDGKPAALAMLQFCADRLWDARADGGTRVTRAAYEAMGGVLGALAHHARGVEEAMTASEIEVARRILLRLVTPDGTRAPAGRGELLSAAGGSETAREVLARLVASRLLVVQDDGEGEAIVELVHESLIARWPLLAGWLAEDRDGIVRLDALRTAVAAWKNGDRSDDLLWRGRPLADLEAWLERSNPALALDERAFLHAARASAGRARRTRQVAVLVAAAVLIGVAVFSTVQWRRSERARAQADAAADDLAHELLKSGAETAHALNKAGQAVALALKAVEQRPDDREARRTLMRAISAPEPRKYLYGHGTSLTAVSWAPTSDRFVTADADGWVIGWTALGTEAWRTAAVEGAVAQLAWSPSGERIAVRAPTGQLVLLDTTGAIAAAPPGPTSAFTWSPDGSRLGVLDPAGDALRVLDADGRIARSHTIPGRARALDWGPRGLATAGDQGRVWLAKGESLRELQPTSRGKRLDIVGWEPQGARLLVGSWTGFIDVYTDLEPVPLPEAEEAISNLVWHPDGGRFLLCPPDDPASVWTPEEGRILTGSKDWEGSPDGVWLPDGSGWATFSEDEWVYRHDSTGYGFRNLKAHSRQVADVEFAPDGSAAVVASRDGLGSLWGPQLLPQRKPSAEDVSSIAWSPSGDRVAFSTVEQGVRIFDLAAVRTTQATDDSVSLRGVGWSASGDHIAWFRRDEPPHAWIGDVPASDRPQVVENPRALAFDEGDNPEVIRWSPDGSVLGVGGAQGYGYLFRPSGRRKHRLPMGRLPFAMLSIEFSADGEDVFMAGRVASAARIRADLSDVAVFEGHEIAAATASPHPTEDLVATSGADGTVRLWNYAGDPLGVFREHQTEVLVIAWSPDGNRLATADRTGSIILRDSTGAPVGQFDGVLGSAGSLRWSPDSTRLAAAARDSRVWILDPNGELIIERKTRDTYVWQVEWSPDGTILAAAGWSGPPYLWPGDDATTLKWARELVGTTPD